MDETRPEKILPKLKENYKNLQQYAIAAATMGSNPQLNNIISNASAQLQRRIMNMENAILSEKLALMKERRKDQRAGMGVKGELKLALIKDANGNIIDSKYIPVPKKVGLNMSPKDLDPTIAADQNAVWAPQVTAQEGQKKRQTAESKLRMDAVRRNFYQESGLVIRGPLDALKERLAQDRLATLEKSGAIKNMTNLEAINEAVKYPEFVVADFDYKLQAIKDNPDLTEEEKDDQIEEKLIDFELDYGFPYDQYRTLFNEERGIEEDTGPGALRRAWNFVTGN
jgi:hypothetical protein